MALNVGMVISGDTSDAQREVSQLTEKTRKFGNTTDAANAEASRSFKQLKASIDPVFRAELNLKRTQDLLTKSVREGVVTQAEATKMMQQYTAATKNGALAQGQMSRRMSSGVSSQRRMGLAVQNSSYQFADLAVQMGGGVDTMRAVGQQLPQLLGGFGILGSVMGAVAAVGITVYNMMSATADAAEKTDDKVILLSESLAALNTVSGEVTTQMREGLVEAFGGSAAAVESLLEALKAERFDRAMAPVRDTIDDVIDQTRLLSDIIPLVYNTDLAAALPTSVLERHKELISENVGLALSLSTENENLLTSLNAIGDAKGPDDLVEKLATARMEAERFSGPVATAVISGLDEMAIEAGVLEQVMSRVSGQGERLAAAFQNAQAESFLFSRRFADEEALMNMPLTVDPRNRPRNTPMRPTGGGGRASSTADKQAAALKKLTDGLQLEIDLLGELDPVNQEMLKLRGQLKGATEAETEAVRALIETRNEERDALDQHISQLDNWRDGARSIFDMIVEGARQGTSAVDILLNVLFDLGSKLTSMAGDSLIDALFGSSGSAGGGAIGGGLSDFFGSIFKFANGDIFDSPTLFGFGNGQLGVMGEAGREGVVPLEHSFGDGIGVQIGDRETALPLTRLKSGKLGAAIQPFANGGAFGGIASSRPTASQSASFAADSRTTAGSGVVNNFWSIQTDNPKSFAESRATTARAANRLMGSLGRHS